MPPVMRKRGRPKGGDLTVIGLPKRRRCNGPQKFRCLQPSMREKGTASPLLCNLCNLFHLHCIWCVNSRMATDYFVIPLSKNDINDLLLSVFISLVILSWFVGDDAADEAVRHSGTINAEQVGHRTATSAALDDNVSLSTVRQYYDAAAWLAIKAVIADIKRDDVWYCAACSSTIDDGESSIKLLLLLLL